jgi:hypothetical protein
MTTLKEKLSKYTLDELKMKEVLEKRKISFEFQKEIGLGKTKNLS